MFQYSHLNYFLFYKRLLPVVLLISLRAGLCAQLTYVNDIAPLISYKCYPCHAQNNSAPIELSSEKSLLRNANLIKKVISSGYMPPWPADIKFSRFCNEKVLSISEIVTLKSWLNNVETARGKTENPKSKVALLESAAREKPDLVIKMKAPYQTSPDGKDNIMQFIIPVSVNNDTFVRKIEFTAGNRRIVHHANYIVLADSGVDASRIKYQTQVQPLVENELPFIDPIPAKNLLYYGGWLPGDEPIEFPVGFGFKLPKKFYILFTIHYAPMTRVELDQSNLSLYYSSTPVSRSIETINFGSFGSISASYPPLVIPPDSIFDFEIRHKVLKDLSVLYINPHMHLLGRTYEAFVILPNSDTLRLVKIDNWDFKWQFFYKFCNLVKIPKGSELVVHARYDNTAQNPFNPFNPPHMVKEGPLTYNEMLSLTVLASYSEDGDEKISLQ